MRRTIVFDDEITNESTNALIGDIHNYEGEVDLFFSTNGGMNIETTAFVHFLNTQCIDKIRIFFTGTASSNGANIMMDFKGEKYISSDLDYVLIHKSHGRVDTGRGKKYVEKIPEQFDELNRESLKKYVKFFKLTKEEKDVYNRGEDVMLYKEDFKRFSDKISLWK